MYSKIKFAVICMISSLVMTGCNYEIDAAPSSWGCTKTYDDFLWKKHVPDTLTRTLCFNFNEDSKNHLSDPLVLGIFKKDETGRYVRVLEDEMQLFVNKRLIKDNTITIPPTIEKLSIGVVFTKKAASKVHYWYIKVIKDGGLDRINNAAPLQFNDESTALMEITAEKKNIWNPLAEGLTYGFSTLLIALLVWLTILKPIIYPTFKIGNISILGSDFSNVIRAKGFLKIVLTSSKEKANQGFFEKLFLGKVKFVVDPRWTSDVTFETKDKNSIRIRLGGDYMVDSRILKKSQEYTLENIHTGNKAKLVIS